ncbi:hypothetical protein Tco_0677498 [Tanacetum coccineum]|uniref:Uncharacterized protein n=1 Tax=Tanacetum coccineum TaxID=301880 RepID=A0ABQ4XCD6_9ASTR
MTTLHDLIAQAMQKKEEEKRIAEEQRLKISLILKVDSTSNDEDSFLVSMSLYVEASPPNLSQLARRYPVPSFCWTKYTPHFPNLFLEETNTFDNSLPESETFCFNLEEPSSGSPTTPSDLSLPDYKAFYIDNDHFKEKSSGSTIPPSHIPVADNDSLMEEIDLFLADDGSIPPGIESDDVDSVDDDTSIFLPEFESFYVDYPNSGNSTIDVVEDIPVDVPNVLPTHLILEQDFIPTSEFFAYVVWIFLPFLAYPVIPPSLLSCGDEDTIFDPGISKEVDIIKKTENQAKMTKLSMEWKRPVQNKAQIQKCQSQSQYRRFSSQTEAGA